jgi:hypothetical protein
MTDPTIAAAMTAARHGTAFGIPAVAHQLAVGTACRFYFGQFGLTYFG